MESKHKNILIGTLLAVVFVMAVGYAAFAQQLQINGTATINSTWDVHFNQTQLSGVGNPGLVEEQPQQVQLVIPMHIQLVLLQIYINQETL